MWVSMCARAFYQQICGSAISQRPTRPQNQNSCHWPQKPRNKGLTTGCAAWHFQTVIEWPALCVACICVPLLFRTWNDKTIFQSRNFSIDKVQISVIRNIQLTRSRNCGKNPDIRMTNCWKISVLDSLSVFTSKLKTSVVWLTKKSVFL